MSYEEYSTDHCEAEDDTENLPQPLAWSVQFVRQNLKECNIQESSPSDSLQTREY